MLGLAAKAQDPGEPKRGALGLSERREKMNKLRKKRRKQRRKNKTKASPAFLGANYRRRPTTP